MQKLPADHPPTPYDEAMAEAVNGTDQTPAAQPFDDVELEGVRRALRFYKPTSPLARLVATVDSLKAELALRVDLEARISRLETDIAAMKASR